MNEININYSSSKQQRTGIIFLILALVGAAFAVYYLFFVETILLVGLVTGIVLAIGGLILFIRLLFAPRKNTEIAITLNRMGIWGRTTPVARAAGLIDWADVVNLEVFRNAIEITVKDPNKYAARMKSFFVKDTFLKAMKGTIKIPITETDATQEAIKTYLAQLLER